MASVGNWVGETTLTIGAGPVLLSGSLDGFTSFASIGITEFWYAIIDGNNREAGVGTLSGNVLDRTTIHSVINNGLYDGSNPDPISLSGGATVFSTFNKAAFDSFAIIDDVVNSIFGRSGIVAAEYGDYSASKIAFDPTLGPNPVTDATDLQLAVDDNSNAIAFLTGSIVWKGMWDADLNIPDIGDVGYPKIHGNWWLVNVAGVSPLPNYPDGLTPIADWEYDDRTYFRDDVDGSGFVRYRPSTDAQYLLLTGGTVTGAVKGITPVDPDDFTRKDFVDQGDVDTLAAAVAEDANTLVEANTHSDDNDALTLTAANDYADGKLAKSGGTMSGDIIASNALSMNTEIAKVDAAGDNIFGSDTRTSAEANTILDNADAGNTGKAILPLITDINVVLPTGFHQVQSNTVGAPSVSRGTLIVCAASEDEALQLFTDIVNGITWIRVAFGGVFTDWQEIFASDTRTSAQANTILDSAYASGWGTMAPLPLPDDNADAGMPSGIYITSDTWVGSPNPGTAGNNQGYLRVTNWNASYALQEFYTINDVNNPAKYRRYNGGVWEPWIEVFHSKKSNVTTGDLTAFSGQEAVAQPFIAATGQTTAYDLIELLLDKVEELETRLANAGIA